MKNREDNLGKVESVTTIIVNIGTIISWVFSVITFSVLASQPEPISLPGIFELNATYKILFLTSIFLGYIQVLRSIWEHRKKTQNEVESSFGGYIYSSLIKLKRPFILIGFLTICGITSNVIFEIDILLGVIMCASSLFGVMFLLTEGSFLLKNARNEFDDEFRKRWLRRLKKQLYQSGYFSQFC